jgi:hypothetical protein
VAFAFNAGCLVESGISDPSPCEVGDPCGAAFENAEAATGHAATSTTDATRPRPGESLELGVSPLNF